MAIILWACVILFPVCVEGNPLYSQLLNHVGKSYTGAQDSSYQDYDLALRKVVADRIHKRYGISLDPGTYSGFDFLEIEGLFKCKKSEEPFDTFLQMFPKQK
jgi:hypothetical protein